MKMYRDDGTLEVIDEVEGRATHPCIAHPGELKELKEEEYAEILDLYLNEEPDHEKINQLIQNYISETYRVPVRSCITSMKTQGKRA
ncbi:hypothetical protein [Paenibacillus mucilaginosus]|uniref:hypothetical protein n=1 Tax=Paenibacillus mucilaginosus TaxID=61624 RepID=UPI003D20484F